MMHKLKSSLLSFVLLILILSNQLRAQDFEDILWTIDVGPKYTALGGNYDSLFLWSNEGDKANQSLAVPGTITNVKWHPNGHLLAVSTQIHKVDGGVRLLDTKTMTFQMLPGITTSGARAIGWNPSGELLAIGDNEGDLQVFDRSGQWVQKVNTGLRSITSLSWHPSQPIITMVSGKIGNYNLDTEALQLWESRKEEILLLAIAWHPTGEFFALGDYGDYAQSHPALIQFHEPDGRLIKAIRDSKAEYRNIRWTEDGERLITVSDAFRVWSKEGELISALPFEHLLWGISFDPQHRQWLVTDETGQVHRVSADGKKLISSTSVKRN